MVGERWMRWTLLEAATKTLTKILQKVAGGVSTTVAHTFFNSTVVGLVQVILGFSLSKKRGVRLLGDPWGVAGSCFFGFFAVIATVASTAAFLYGGDMGVNTFIITLSIIPGAIADSVWFGHRLRPKQWAGVLLAVVAGYSVLGWPSLTVLAHLPLWVWLSFVTMFAVATNQVITQKIQRVDPFFKNFWGGLTSFVLSVAGVLVLGGGGFFASFTLPMRTLWAVSLLQGLLVVGMWSFNLFAYKGGASIALKKLVMNGTYLTTAMLAGALLFREHLTAGKGVGVALYLGAFALLDERTGATLYRLLFARRTTQESA